MAIAIPRTTLNDAADVAGLDTSAIRAKYSGRGMYGGECFGIVCDVGEFALFCAALGSSADDWDFVGRAQSDGMGLSTIWYFPGVTTDGKDDDDDDDDE